MSHSKNDLDCMGGTLRRKFHKVNGKGQYDAILSLIDPNTNAPYTYSGLMQSLQQRTVDYPTLAPLTQRLMKMLDAKASKNPDRTYSRTCRGKDIEEAEKRSNQELVPHFKELARLLFRPQWESNLPMGNVTLFQYAEYMEDSLYSGLDLETAKRLKSLLRRKILPIIGETRLSDFTKEQQEKAIRKIKKLMNEEKSEESTRGYIKRSYVLFFAQIEESYRFEMSPIYLADQIDTVTSHNNALLNCCRADHLDTEVRKQLFETARQQESKLDLLLLALFYSGMSEKVIPAHQFREIEEYQLDQESVFALPITKIVPKSKQHHSVLSVTNPKFPISEFRIVVLYPWAEEIVKEYAEELRAKGLSGKKIAEMPLSGFDPKKSPIWPEEIIFRLEALMKKAGIPNIQVTRTDKDGKAYPEKIEADIRLLRKDAQYVALNICGASTAMMHAMFGTAWTEVDEEAYLGMYSPEYTVCRYLHLRRFLPFESQAMHSDLNTLGIGRGKKGRYSLNLKNTTNVPQTLSVYSDYAINGYWRK